MPHSVKRNLAKRVISFFGLSNLIFKLYPVATENAFPGLSRKRLDELRQLFPLSINRELDFVRIGSFGDGGYLLHNDFSKEDYCLSLGIGDNYSFDLAMSEICKEVWMFDHTIEDPDIESNQLKFNKIGIAPSDEPNFITISKILEGIPVSNDIILKMDIEGSEWEVLDRIPVSDLSRCKQIVAEFHNLHQIADNQFFHLVASSLEKLNRSHDLVNFHVNNWSRLHIIQGVPFPDVIEVTYIRRTIGFQPNNRITSVQSAENSPNNVDLPDYSSNFIDVIKVH